MKSGTLDSRKQPDSSEDNRNNGYEILPNFQRFRQKNDIFCRAFWDDSVRSEKTQRFFETFSKQLEDFRNTPGFSQKDYALRNASWHVTNIFADLKSDEDRREGYLNEYTVHRKSSDTKYPVDDPESMSNEIKQVASLFGADLTGITAFYEDWVYSHNFSRETLQENEIKLPDGLKHVIVIATEMNFDIMSTNPSALSGSATGAGYAVDTVLVLGLTQYIRNLGYCAIGSLNDTAMTIPYAIQAGLGEYGRHSLLITKEFGPRVRLAKIFTDLPLVNDKPIRFGVKEFCDVCRRCTDACPVKAITNDEPSDAVYNRSNLVGIKKWTTNAEKCFRFWSNQNSDCSICIRVCPYNKNFSRWARKIFVRLASSPLRRFILKLDKAFGFGKRMTSKWWWKNAGKKITSNKFGGKA
jgi:epoxyqueuosine reductase